MHAIPGKFSAKPDQAAAFDSLQSAILRLAERPSARPAGIERQELGARVERALAAYREYMKVVKQ